jgi:hypothetical protein
MGLEHTMPFEKAIDLVEDLETQHTLQLGLVRMSASPADSGPSRTVIPAHCGQRSGDCGQFLMSV